MQSRFIELCNDFCEIAGLARVEPETDEDGAMVANMSLNEVELQFLCESESADRVFSRVNFGPIEAADDTQQWGELLEVNFGLSCVGGPVFSRDPWIGTVVLQQRWAASTAAAVLLEALSRQCTAAREWRVEGLSAFALAEARPSVDPILKA